MEDLTCNARVSTGVFYNDFLMPGTARTRLGSFEGQPREVYKGLSVYAVNVEWR